MELYLIRHGIAAGRGPAFPDDGVRPLTSEGVARLRVEVRAFVTLGVRLDRILTSPLVRARQTADIFASAYPVPVPLTETAALAIGGVPDEVRMELARWPDTAAVALVGHEPGIGELACALIGARAPIAFKKGAVCRIDLERGQRMGRLRWFLTPKMLRIIGATSHAASQRPSRGRAAKDQPR